MSNKVTFDNSYFMQMPSGVRMHQSKKKIYLKDYFDPFDPPSELIEACDSDISPGSTSFYIGRAPVKSKYMPTKIHYPTIEQLEVFNSDKLNPRYTKGLESTSTIGGGTVGSKRQFRSYSLGKHEIPKSYNKQKKLITNLWDKLYPNMYAPREVNKHHIYSVPFRKVSVGGGDCDFGDLLKKGSGYGTMTAAASRLWDIIHSKAITCNSFYRMGSREKPNFRKECGTEVCSRNLNIQDAIEYFTAKPYAYQIEQALFRADNIPIKLGKNLTSYGFTNILDDMKLNDWGFEFDWSLFDSTLVRDKIVAAFSIVRNMFPKSSHIDNFFIYQCDGFLDKFYVDDFRDLYKVTRGNPSGSVWTTIINSLVNCLLMEDIGMNYRGFAGRTFSYIVAGDDGVFFCDYYKDIKFNSCKLITWCNDKFYGMKIDIIKKGKPIMSDPDQSLCFNKLVYYMDDDTGYVKPTVQPKLLHARCAAIRKDPKKDFEFQNFLEGQLYSMIVHPDCIDLVALLYDEFAYGRTPYIYGPMSGGNSIEHFRWKIVNINNDLFFSTDSDKTFVSMNMYKDVRSYPMGKDHDDPDINRIADQNHVRNWLYDNVLNKYVTKPNERDRYMYLVQKFGLPLRVMELYKYVLIKKEYIIKNRQFSKILEQINDVMYILNKIYPDQISNYYSDNVGELKINMY
jgi:hypothetical protein